MEINVKSTKKRSNDSSKKFADELGRQRLVKVLMTLLNESCSHYEWAPKLAGFIRARRWDLLYKWAESTTTEVYGDVEEHYSTTQIAALVRKYP